MKKCCINCEYFLKTGDFDSDSDQYHDLETYGECRRFPPVYTPVSEEEEEFYCGWSFAFVEYADRKFCGEFKESGKLTGGEPLDLHTFIWEEQLGSRTFNVLKNANIKTPQALAKKSAIELLRLQGFGKGSLDDVKKYLSRLGLHLS